MIEFVWIKYAHFIGVFMVVSSLFAELVLVKNEVSGERMQLLSKIDGVYGLGALIAVSAGLALWFSYGKPADFYTSNSLFLIKVSLFTIVGILSIWPTIFFVKNRKAKGEDSLKIPRGIRISILIEVILLLVLPLLAVAMANGIDLR
ncbi:MAG: DUF2214 family protein [Cyclobacteriaceae bacterium]